MLKRFLFIWLIFIAGCFRSHDRQQPLSMTESVQKKESFFATVPLARYANSGAPCLDISIEGKSYCLEIDLGDNDNLHLNTEVVEQIENKTFIGEGTAWGIQGIPYSYRQYTIPQYWIGQSYFLNPNVCEDGGAIHRGAFLAPAEIPERTPPPAEGTIGWRCFAYSNLLLDMKNDQIAFCDSWETLERKGYRKEDFTVVPITLDTFIMFDISVNGKTLSCMLDTGSSFSILNTELPEGVSLYEQAADKAARLTYNVNIQGYEGGEVSFMQIPLRFPVKVDAILGMNFIRRHLIFIDFSNKTMYLSR